MYFYFLSEYPAVIKLNGIYFGQIYPDAKSIDIDLLSQTFVEICSMKKDQPSSSFIIDDHFTDNFDAHASLTDLDGGYFICFKSQNKKNAPFLLSQEKFSDLLVSVFNQDGLKVSIETQNDFYVDDISGEYTSAKITKFMLDNRPLLLICLENDDGRCLLVYDYLNKINRLLFDKIDDFGYENGLYTTVNFKDVLKHQKCVWWGYDDGKLTAKSTELKSKIPFNKDNYHESILPYVFLEELLLGGDVSPFLTDEIKSNADKLLLYFDGVLGVMPPPIFKDQSLIGLIYKKCCDRYYVKYAEISLTDKLISNIKII